LNSRFSSTDEPDVLPTSLDWGSPESEANLALQAFAGSQRTVYPYSVVPGGIQSAEDLRWVSEHDQVVAGHFAAFDFRHARMIELNQGKLFYLSYRIGDKVFWTTKQVTLRKGEKLITDGNITARTRCANQVSELPQAIVSPAEPQLAQLEQPLPPPIPLPEYTPASYPELQSVTGPLLPPAGYGPVPVGILPPIGYPPTCVPPKSGKPGPGKPKPCPPGPPPPGVPEPGTVLLFSSGIAGIYWRLRKTAKH
jgi:hypothetical protein